MELWEGEGSGQHGPWTAGWCPEGRDRNLLSPITPYHIPCPQHTFPQTPPRRAPWPPLANLAAPRPGPQCPRGGHPSVHLKAPQHPTPSKDTFTQE